MSKFRPVSHVIFDMDGVLLDTEGIYRTAIALIGNKFGKRYTSEMAGKVTGTVARDSARIAIQEMKLPLSVDDFLIEFKKSAYDSFKKYGTIQIAGARTLVEHLARNKIPMAVATSSSTESFEIKTKNHKDFFNIFNHVVCGGSDPEVVKGKPAPDIFRIAASRFVDKPPPEKCLVFEDAPNGVQAAVCAGMQVVMIPDENCPLELRKQATLVVQGLDMTPLECFALPPLKS